MEADQFKDTLKEMAADFTVSVDERLFSGVLHKQQLAAKQRKKRLIMVMVASLFLGSLVTWVVWSNHQQHQNTIKSVASSKRQTINNQVDKRINLSGSTASSQHNVLEESPAVHNSVKGNKNNTQLLKQHPMASKNYSFEPAYNKKAHATQQLSQLPSSLPVSKPNKVTPKQAKSNSPLMEITPVERPKLPNEKEPFTTAPNTIVDKQVETNQSVKNSDSLNQQSSPSAALTLETKTQANQVETPVSIVDSIKQNPVTTGFKPRLGIYAAGTYHLITSARNLSSTLPAKFKDTLGLKEKANYAYGFSGGMVYQYSPQLAFMVGFGYHTVFFDEIKRALTTKLDSTEIFSNAVAEKIAMAFPINYTTETRLSWVEMPVQVKYQFTTNGKWGYYAQTGLSLQYLVSQRGYAIVENRDGTSTFTPYDNYELERFNKAQLVWLLDAGIDFKLNKQVGFNVGLNYRKHLNSYYKDTYIKRNAAGFMGFTSGVFFLF